MLYAILFTYYVIIIDSRLFTQISIMTPDCYDDDGVAREDGICKWNAILLAPYILSIT